MKRLILMRHAKSSWADPDQADIDRPLNPRGIRDAAKIGHWLLAKGTLPDRALISVARRARETWAGVVGVIGARPVDYLPELYDADPRTLLAALHGAAGDLVLMIGHQPGIGALAQRLVPIAPPDPGFADYPTAATAVIDFDVADWAQIDWRRGRVSAFTVPRALD